MKLPKECTRQRQGFRKTVWQVGKNKEHRRFQDWSFLQMNVLVDE
jgi:hypothetical protein